MSINPREIPTGAVRYNTDSNKMEVYIGSTWMEVAVSSPNLDGGARGVFGGSYTYTSYAKTNIIDFITISSTGNAIDFGDLTETRGTGGAGASRTRGMWCGGDINPDGNKTSNTVDFVTISSTGNATDFGDLTGKRGHGVAVMSNQTRIVAAGGNNQSPSDVNTIDFATIASTGNFIDFGDISTPIYGLAGAGNPVRGIISNGDLGPAYDNTIRFITIPTTGNSTDFGESTVSKSGPGALSSSTRCLIGSGSGPSGYRNTIDIITIATLGNAVKFGENDFTNPHRFPGTATDCVRGVFAGGYGDAPTYVVTTKMDYVNISTEGNGVDFGDLTAGAAEHSGCSNGHGGL